MSLRCLPVVVLASLSFILLYVPSNSNAQPQRQITVKDSIEMTRWADADYLLGADPEGNIASFSPDGKHFVVVLRKADLARNANVYSLLLFDASRVHGSPAPRVLVRMSSSSNEAAIRGVKWLKDNQSLAFIGIREPGRAQVYTLAIGPGRLVERTRHTTGVDQFDISADGRRILFTARPAEGPDLTRDQRMHGVVIENQTLEQILEGKFNHTTFTDRLFYQQKSEVEIEAPVDHRINPFTRLYFSPNGQFAVFTAYFLKTSSSWTEYQNHTLEYWSRNQPQAGSASVVSQYFLFDCGNFSVHSLLDAPATYNSKVRWAPDSHAVYLRTFLPLAGVSGEELAQRRATELPVEISVSGLETTRMSALAWDETQPVPNPKQPEILINEDLNSPPKIVARDPVSAKSAVIMDFNPQFSQLRFGQVEELHLSVKGVPVLAGMYLPPVYEPGRRYPLVIQTHGFDPKRFSMDGRNEWSSGFAARVLAASGIVVVQMEEFANQEDHDKVGADRSLGPNLVQSFRNFSDDCIRQVIHDLNERGLIDPDRVGISAFSRTVWFVSYLLTHASEPKFRTALLSDGIDGGYFDYIAQRLIEFKEDNGGKAPFGPDGLELWMKESPGFQLNRVCIPVRLVSIDNRLDQWEWFSAGKMQAKPVELIEIPGGSHLLERPWDRRIAMQGIVDWFRFWLEDYVDPASDKQAQYARWEKLKGLEAMEEKSVCTQ